ncbi:MAG: glycosyltransferase [Oscillospiraceae bacterium]|nr:glycosyltransferase [Oscillospiraceae bacterium]
MSILTVTIITKNESEYLPRCLSALSPLLSKPWCSLVITDTGSTDNTVSIARKYTNSILNFKWCDDFSAARNFALDRISSEWIMYIDPDEIFSSLNGIISFFESGDYKKYNSASFILKNHADKSGKVFTFQTAKRLYKLTKETRFTGKIHEHIPLSALPVKRLDDTADHFGYIRSGSNMKLKSKRNSELIISSLKTDPKNIMLYCQAADAFGMGEDYQQAEKYALAGLEKGTSEHITPRLSLRTKLMAVQYASGKYYSVYNSFNIYLDEKKDNSPSPDTEAYYYGGMSLAALKEYTDAEKLLSEYFSILDKYRKDPSAFANDYFEAGCCDELSEIRAVNALAECYIANEKYTSAESILKRTKAADRAKNRQITENRLSMAVRLAENGLYDIFEETAPTVYKNSPVILYTAVMNSPCREKLSEYINGFSDALKGIFTADTAADPCFGCEVLYQGLKNGDISPVGTNIYSEEAISAMLSAHDDIYTVLEDYTYRFNDHSIYQLKNLYTLYDIAVKTGDCNEDILCTLFEFAAESGYGFYSTIYTETALNGGYMLLLPDDAKGICAFYKAFSADKRSPDFIKGLREGIALIPGYAEAVRAYTKSIQKPKTELEVLSEIILKRAFTAVSEGKYAEAAAILDQYLSMLPNDKKAMGLRKKAASMM